MCGIVGIFDPEHERIEPELRRTVELMTETVRRRGPDDSGLWVDANAGIALGHRRLSVIDLSPEGHQPMHSASGRFVITFNGEIYNFNDLRAELEGRGRTFRGHSDTEVLLAAIDEWGADAAVRRCNGMFAFALWDRRDRVLTLARDRFGEKPLYFGMAGRALLFASDLAALRVDPRFVQTLDRDALTLYFRYSCIPAPHSAYVGVRKLEPATLVSVRGRPAIELGAPRPYWSAREVAERGANAPLRASSEEIVEQLDVLLRDSVKLRMQSDVPLGAFLSGGIDSSAIVAAAQAQSTSRVRTFTIGMSDARMNEAEHAKRVAAHLGTDHVEHYVTPREAMDVLPQLPAIYSEPFADSSQIPTYLVSALARRHVTVSLSGDGGDELFAGYHRHFWRMWERIERIPSPVRRRAASVLEGVAGTAAHMLSNVRGVRRARSKLWKLSSVIGTSSPEDMYRGLVSHWKRPTELVLGAKEAPSIVADPSRWAQLDAPTRRMMYLDAVGYLPDDILVKLDRATMAVGLEGRIPFLDPRLFELAWRIPLDMHLGHPQGKWLLRRVLDRYVPRTLTERAKHGFGIPLDAWLRGPLREWAESLLAERRLATQGLLDPAPIRKLWTDFLSGAGEWQFELWDVLMLQAWLAHNEPSSVDRASTAEVVSTERPFRVLHVFGRMDRGGAEMRTLDILRNIDRSKYCYEFLALSGLPGSLDDEIRRLGGEVHPIRLGVGFMREYHALLRRKKYDVVHSHVLYTSGLLLRAAAKEGVPTRIAHFRSTSDVDPPGVIRGLQQNIMRRWIDAYATKILAVSECAMETCWGPNWRKDPRCTVMYNGLDLSLFADSPDGVRAEFEVERDAPLLIHVGSFNSAKNHIRLLSIFARVHRHQPSARLLVVGRDAEGLAEQLRDRIRDLGLQRAVTLVGERNDVPRLLKAADLMVFPSKREGLPGAVLEACAAGTPVLASDLPCICEVARFLPSVRCVSLDAGDDEWAERASEMLARAREHGARDAVAQSFKASPFTINRVVADHTALFHDVPRT